MGETATPPGRRLALVMPSSRNPSINIVWEIKYVDNPEFGNPGDVWHEVGPEVEVGWMMYPSGNFTPAPPEPPGPTGPIEPGIPGPEPLPVQEQIAALNAQIQDLQRQLTDIIATNDLEQWQW